MKWIYLMVVAITILATGCEVTRTTVKMNVACNKSTKEVYQDINMVLLDNQFEVTKSDLNSGVLSAHKIKLVFGTGDVAFQWEFLFKQDSVIAYCKYRGKYLDDKTERDNDWYWTVRNQLEAICKNKIVFVRKEFKERI